MISGFDTFCANSKKDILPSEETLESNIFSFNSSVVLDTRILFESKDENFFTNIDKHISCIRNVI
jgi:flagellar basal body-associated protein FliL